MVGNQRQLWAKQLGGGAVAALVINASPHLIEAGVEELNFTALNVTASDEDGSEGVTVRDIWQRGDLGPCNIYSFMVLQKSTFNANRRMLCMKWVSHAAP